MRVAELCMCHCLIQSYDIKKELGQSIKLFPILYLEKNDQLEKKKNCFEHFLLNLLRNDILFLISIYLFMYVLFNVPSRLYNDTLAPVVLTPIFCNNFTACFP